MSATRILSSNSFSHRSRRLKLYPAAARTALMASPGGTRGSCGPFAARLHVADDGLDGGAPAHLAHGHGRIDCEARLRASGTIIGVVSRGGMLELQKHNGSLD